MGYPIFHSRFLLFLFFTYFCSRNFVIVLFAVVSACVADFGALSVSVYVAVCDAVWVRLCLMSVCLSDAV